MYTCLEVSSLNDDDFDAMFQDSLASLEGGNFPFRSGISFEEKKAFFRSRFKEGSDRIIWSVIEDATGEPVAYYSGLDDGTNLKVYTGVYRSGHPVGFDFAHAQCDFFKARGYQTIEAYCIKDSTAHNSMSTAFDLDCYEYTGEQEMSSLGHIKEIRVTLRVM